jgi:hypothetical protein
MIAGTRLSLEALSITFLTYCLYRPLRTLLGKNNMNLVFALFCALGLLELALIELTIILNALFWVSAFIIFGYVIFVT